MPFALIDTLSFDHVDYQIMEPQIDLIFDPMKHIFNPREISMNCLRGSKAVYTVTNDKLFLSSLHIRLTEAVKKRHLPDDQKLKKGIGDGDFYYEYGRVLKRIQGPTLNSITPTRPTDTHDIFNNHYDDINLPMSFSGSVYAVKGFIDELYEEEIVHPTWKYRIFQEFVFEDGELIERHDRTKAVELIRLHETPLVLERQKPEELRRSDNEAIAEVYREQRNKQMLKLHHTKAKKLLTVAT